MPSVRIYPQAARQDFAQCHPIEGSAVGGGTARLLGRLWLRATAVAVAVLVPSALATVLAMSLSPASVGIVVAVVAFCATFLLSNVVEPFGEWRSLVKDRAPSAGAVYGAVCGDLGRSQVPASIRAFRAALRENQNTVANRLEITDGSFTVHVSVFPYGTGLYMGWSMFRRRSGAAVLRATAAEFIRSLERSKRPNMPEIETERANALREAVHASCLAGLRATVEGIDVPPGFSAPGEPPTVPFMSFGGPAGSVEQPTAAVSIYLADARGAERLEAAVEGFLAGHGFEVVSKGEPVISG